jgi:hypothetical protein
MSDKQLVQFGKAAPFMCSPKANVGQHPRETFVIQLEEARVEWRRRHPRIQEAKCHSPVMRLFVSQEKRQQQISDCSCRAAKKILTKLKSSRPSEATLAELIAGEFEGLTR